MLPYLVMEYAPNGKVLFRVTPDALEIPAGVTLREAARAWMELFGRKRRAYRRAA